MSNGAWTFVSAGGKEMHGNDNEFTSSIFNAFLNVGNKFALVKLEETLRICVQEARDILEAGGHIRSGQLYESITYEIFPEMLMGRFGSDVPYAKYVEYGTSRMEGIHFLEGALNAVKTYLL